MGLGAEELEAAEVGAEKFEVGDLGAKELKAADTGAADLGAEPGAGREGAESRPSKVAPGSLEDPLETVALLSSMP